MVSGDYIYGGSVGGYIYCINKTTGGKVVWEFKAEDNNGFSSPVVSENYVYVGSWDGYVYAFAVLKLINSSCSKSSECKTDNCFKGVCREGNYCTIDSYCSSGQYCSYGKCETLKSTGSSCSEDSECMTNNCFIGVCRKTISWFFIISFISLLVIVFGISIIFFNFKNN